MNPLQDNPKNFIAVAAPYVGLEEVAAVSEVLLAGRYIAGPKVEQFERQFAEFIGTDFAVAVSNGTSALFIALEAMGVGPGDEVVVPPLTFFATIAAVIQVGAKPVFADIDPDDLCLSPESVRQSLSPRTKALLPVHLYGAAAKMDQLMDIAEGHGLLVLEDCAQAIGSQQKGRTVGTIGQAGAFSFMATKHITTGEGGMITTNSAEVAQSCRVIRNHGMTDRDTHARLGFNNRLNEIGAALGLVQMTRLPWLLAKRIENSEYLINGVRHFPWAHAPLPQGEVRHTYFWCPLMVKPESGRTVQELKAHLTQNGIGFRQRYEEPLYRQPALARADLDYRDLHLPNAEMISGQVIGLPNHPGLDRQQLDRVLAVLEDF